MITKNEIREIIGKVMVNNIEYNNCDSLYESGILDSLKIIHLILLIEKEFNISIDQSFLQMEDFESVDCLYAYLNNIRENV